MHQPGSSGTVLSCTLVTGVSGLMRITVAANTSRNDKAMTEPFKINQNPIRANMFGSGLRHEIYIDVQG